jgi:hypothetical protein
MARGARQSQLTVTDLSRVDVMASRFRPSHFLMFHDDGYGARRCATFAINLTGRARMSTLTVADVKRAVGTVLSKRRNGVVPLDMN